MSHHRNRISIRMTEISYYIPMISAGTISISKNKNLFYNFVADPLDEEGIIFLAMPRSNALFPKLRLKYASSYLYNDKSFIVHEVLTRIPLYYYHYTNHPKIW